MSALHRIFIAALLLPGVARAQPHVTAPTSVTGMPITGGQFTGSIGVTGNITGAGTLIITLPGADSKSLFVGSGAGAATSGANQQNTGFGYNALNAETSTAATAFGYNALVNTTGHANTAFGAGAGGSVTTGTDNVAIGNDALLHNDGVSVFSGSQSIAIGVHALSHETTGTNNIGIGSLALVGCGNWVGFPICDLTGSNNTVVGYHGLLNVQGAALENTALGALVGGALTTGTENILLGSFAGSNLTTGTLNIMIGRDVRGSGATVSNELNIGNLIRGQGLTQGGDATSGNVDIYGTITPRGDFLGGATHATWGDTATRTLIGGSPASITTASAASVPSIIVGQWSADAAQGLVEILKSRATTPGTHATVAANDTIGQYGTYLDDGTSYLVGGALNYSVVGTVATGNVKTQAAITVRNGASLVNGLIIAGNTGIISTGSSVPIADTTGHILGLIDPVAKTTAYPVTAADSGIHFHNNGAGAGVTFTLPTAAAGLHYCFAVVAAQAVTVAAATNEKIAIGASNSAATGNITNSTPFGHVCIEALTTLQWIATSNEGTWTVN